jgi:prevent-host-death family protein
MTTTVNVHEAKTNLSKLLEAVERGESFIIARAGQPVARLEPLPKVDIVFGGMKDVIWVADDAFTPETDAEIWADSEYSYEVGK